jgi:Ca2+-binding RTX toxin-like protein
MAKARSQQKHKKNARVQSRKRFLGLIERLEERLPLTGPYTNASLSAENLEALLEGTRGLAGLGDRIDSSGYFAEPLGPIKNRDGSAVTPGLLGPYGRTLREEIENPIDDYFDNTPIDQRSTDSLIAHLGSNPAFLSIEGGVVDGTIDELVFDIHVQRQYDSSLLDIEFDHEELPSMFDAKGGVEMNLRAVVDIQYVFGISLDPSLNNEQTFFIRDYALSSSIRADTVLHPFLINLGILEASVPDVVLAASLDIEVSQPSSTPSLRLTEINTLEVDELFETTIGDNDFNATFNLDVGLGRWRLEGSTYLQAVGDWLGFEPAITFSPNFDEVFLFNNITSGELVAGMENFQAWLSSFSNSNAYNVPVPFAASATTGSVYDVGQGMSGFSEDLRDEDGFPVFDNAQDFPYTGNGIDYNATTNKIKFTIIQALPEQQLQSRDTRVSVDDTLGLTSDTEALVTGRGTLSFVLSVDLSNENVDFRDRIAVEDLRIQTFYGTEAVVLTGNAAYGGLGLAFANAVLSGDFSTTVNFGDALTQVRKFTLHELNNALSDIDSILLSPIAWLGDVSLRVPSLSVMGNLFGLASDAFVEVSVSDIASGLIETTTNASDLLNFEDISFEGLTDTLSEALFGTEAWDSEGDAAVATLGVSLDDFGPLKQDQIVDALADAVEEADNAVGIARRIVQDVPDLVQNLVVHSGAGAVQFVSNLTYHTANGVLSWLVDASAEETSTVDVGLGFDSLFDFTGDDRFLDTEDLVGEEASLPASSFSRLLLGLEFDPPPPPGARSLPRSYLNSQSRLERTVYVNATPALGSPVEINGASGALGMKLQNGSVVIAQNLTSPDPASPAQFFSSIPTSVGRVRVSELTTYQPQRTTLGRLRADFEVVPDHTTPTADPSRLTFRINNLNNPGNSINLQSSPDFRQMKQGLDPQVNLNALAPSLDEWFKKVGEKVAQEVLGKAYPLIGDKLEQFTNFIEELRDTITTALDALSSFTVSDVENAIETALESLFCNPSNLRSPFCNPSSDFVHVDLSLPTQFKMTLDIEGIAVNVQKVVQTDLGLPALGADWRSELSVVGTYDFQVTFVLDLNQGFYVETNTEHIGLALDIDMLGQATGKLGFFEIIATASAPAPGQSAFHAEYAINLTEPSGDNKLFLREIGTGPLIDTATSGLTGEAALRFTIEAVVNEWLPSIETGLRIDWEFDGIGFGGSNPPLVTYEGIQLNLGRLLDEVFLPFFETIQTVFDPFSDAILFLTDPLPVLKDFTDPPVSILGLAQEFARALPADSDIRRSIESLAEFVETLATINRIVTAIHTDSGSGLSLQLGDITFGGTSSPQFDARLDALDPAVVGQANARSNLRSQFDGPSGAPNLSAELNTTPGALHVPIIEDPLSAIGWILGVGEANLLTWDLPNVVVSFPVDFTFPIFPGILASIFGGLEVGTDLKVGLDTAGFSAYAKSKDLADLFQGFYVSDRADANGTGADVNELYIRGELFAGAGVGFEILGGVSLIVGGGVFAEVGLDLLDHDNDGKVRGRDLSSSEGCFALNGELGVALEAQAKAGIFKYELPITEVTLFRGRTEIACPFYEPPPPTILAGLDSATGTLTLFMGPEAHQRNVKPNVEEESFSVEEAGVLVIVSAFGKTQYFRASQVGNIVADGGSKDDRITLGASVTKPSILRGGDGDDVIHGGSSTNFIDGGRGRDELYGGADRDILVGSFGDDLLLGEAGEDHLFGQEGDDILYGGEDNDTIETGGGKNKAYGEGGNDTILGGALKDILYGGDDDDTIDGGDGPDVLNGEAGIDTLRGQDGDDLIDGGADGDFIYGDQGDDRLWGRGGVDEINGGVGLDYLNGGEDGDFLYGQGDADEIDGDAGDDEIEGGTGDDLIYGGTESDIIKGGNDVDVIYGGSGGDTIDGGNDNDEIYGEAGNDTLSGGTGDDEIDGGKETDTIYGFEMDLLADALPIGATDRDTLRGGQGSDRIAGGPDNDMIYGEEDADVLLGNEGSDTIEGNDGSDTIYGFHSVTVWSPVSGGTDGPNQLFGNLGDDAIHGGPEADFIRGQKGNDTIFGEQGADTIFGDAGDDTIEGGVDVDHIDGGTGDDRIIGGDASDFLYGNDGNDIVEGNDGDDIVNGNDQSDVLYGDNGMDTLRGGRGNDTVRGGAEIDLLFGDDGNDLLLGNDGDDTIEGNNGDDVIYGGANVDTVAGGMGDDRIYGELGADTLHGNQGNDVVEGGAGNDTITGDSGDDALYGDNGNDDISGGDDNDFIAGGNGVTNYLRGDRGNDTIVGSDEGTDDPNFKDTTYFGDRIEGGDGNDRIDGLGGADVVDGGLGNDYIYGGMHGDWLIGGPKVIAAPDQDNDEIYGGDGNDQIDAGDGNDSGNGGDGINTVDGGAGSNTIVAVGSNPIPIENLSTGPERRGLWAELSDSASTSGITQIGGLEQSVFATEGGAYVAWVDWRNGNTEIYVAYHDNDIGEWQSLVGIGLNNSASGGGISNDTNQSRRPTLFKTANDDSLIVAWTTIDANGNSSIEVAREDTNWARETNPGQTGKADHAKWVQFADESGILAWLDSTSGVQRAAMAQYIWEPACFTGFRASREITGVPPGLTVTHMDVDSADYRVAFVLAYGDSTDHDLIVASSLGTQILGASALCPGAPGGAGVDVLTPSGLVNIHSEVDPEVDTTNPTVAIQFIQERTQGQNENELETDVLVAWERSVERSDQVDGVVVTIELDGAIGAARQLIPETLASGGPLLNSDTVSRAIGYAAKPELAASYFGSFLAWMDDDTFDGNSDSSIFILSRYRDTVAGPYVMSEFERNDASGRGLSRTGGSLQSLSLGLPENGFASTYPYAVWTEASMETTAVDDSRIQSVYLRVTQQGLSLVDDFSAGGKFRRQGLDVLANDINLFGEIDAKVVMIDGRPLNNQPIEFTSPLGATVKANPDGGITYDPRGVAAFRALKRGDRLTESFVYRVDNFIHQAEAIATFTVIGRNRWHNEQNAFDVNNSNSIDPLDVLVIINDLNSQGVRELPHDDDETVPPAFLDVDDDGTVSPLDVLIVINKINSDRNGEGEGESIAAVIDTRFGSRPSAIRPEEIDAVMAAASTQFDWEEVTLRKGRGKTR